VGRLYSEVIKAAQMALNRLFALSLCPVAIYEIRAAKRKITKMLKLRV
jgi:hypothetical protein